MPLLLLSVILNCVLLLSGCGLNGGTHRVARGTEVPPPETTDVTYTGGVDAFRRTVYVITRRDCIGCHRNSTFLPNHASDDLEGTAYPIAKTKVDFNNIPNSLFVRQIMNGHCGNPAICQKDGTEMIAAITAWKAVEVAAVPGDLKISICQDQSSIGASNQRLLSKVAYTNTLRDLYGASVVTSVADTLGQVPDEHAGFGTFTSQGMSISSRHVEAYFNVAEKIAGLVSASTTSRASIQSCLASSTTSLSERLTCVDTFLNDHAQKAYRRPLNPTEKSELKNLYVAGEPRGHAEGVKLLLWGMLQARPFLYLFESDGAIANPGLGTYQLTSYEIAARMSYFIWNTMPDNALLDAAKNGLLLTEAGREISARRLLGDAKAKGSIQGLYRQWLKLDEVPTFNYSAPFKEGTVTTQLRDAALSEILQFSDYITWVKKGNYQDMLLSTKAFVTDGELAKLYGVTPNPSAAIDLPTSQRAGYLTRVAMLATGNDDYSPILRGRTIKKQILCDAMPPPPDGAAQIAAGLGANVPSGSSYRQKTDIITSPTSCQACHSLINPLGYVFGNYDSLGRFGTIEKHFVNGSFSHQSFVDSFITTTLVTQNDLTATGAVEFSRKIADTSKANLCFVKQIFRYGMGRAESGSDDGCHLQKMYDGMTMAGGSIYDALLRTVTAPQFAMRRFIN